MIDKKTYKKIINSFDDKEFSNGFYVCPICSARMWYRDNSVKEYIKHVLKHLVNRSG